MIPGLAVGVLVAAAVLLITLPGRPPRQRRRRMHGRRGPWGVRRAFHLPRRRPAGTADLGVVATEVATRLRAGADVETAWRLTLVRAGLVPDGERTPVVGEDGVPQPLLALAGRGGGSRTDEATRGALPGTLAACRLTHELGAPLAEVLDRCAAGLTEAGQARAARSVALAGPRATARLLGWLPLLGLSLGAAVGADPVGVLLGGGIGSAGVVAGAVLMLLGHRWVARLERAARRAGS